MDAEKHYKQNEVENLKTMLMDLPVSLEKTANFEISLGYELDSSNSVEWMILWYRGEPGDGYIQVGTMTVGCYEIGGFFQGETEVYLYEFQFGGESFPHFPIEGMGQHVAANAVEPEQLLAELNKVMTIGALSTIKWEAQKVAQKAEARINELLK